jgi:multiple sugar transport system ATP-binding protein
MDEPLSNLDAKLRVQMRAEIAQLQRSLGTTTIYVTHDQTEAMTLGTRVAVIHGGVLQQVASPQELYSRPANLFVAGFIGSPAMNLVDARLERDEQSSAPAVVFGAHRLPIPPQVVIEHPALARYLGRDIVLGIRPEDMHDAELARDADPPAIIKLPVKLREELGSEVQVHGAIGTAAHVSGAEAEDVRSLATMVARMSPKTTIKEGDVARVLVDTGALHFFDRATGESIRGRRGPGRTTLPSPD